MVEVTVGAGEVVDATVGTGEVVGGGSAADEGVEVTVGTGEVVGGGSAAGEGMEVGVGSPPPQAAKTASVSRSRGVANKRFTRILYRISSGYRMPI